MDKVNIYIVAGPNKGKTTIASIIQEALEANAFKRVELRDTKPSTEAKQPIGQRLEATRGRPVEIVVVPSATSTDAMPIPPAVARNWIVAMKNARIQIQNLGSPNDSVNQAHVKELDEAIEQLSMFCR